MQHPCYRSPSNFLKPFFLTGQIPTSLGNCTKLTKLWLHANQLTGKCMIHHTLLPRKVTIFFYWQGAIPVSLGNCVNLAHLYLSRNKLTGKCVIRATILPQILLSPSFWQVEFQMHLEIASNWRTLIFTEINLKVNCSIRVHFSLDFLQVIVFSQENYRFPSSKWRRKESRFTWSAMLASTCQPTLEI